MLYVKFQNHRGKHTPAGGGQGCYKLFLVFMFRLMCPKVLLALQVIRSMWEFQDRPSEMSTPKYLALVTASSI